MESTNMQFKAEVQQLLHMMIHSVYSNKDIFIRELVANAADAIDKARFESLKQSEFNHDWQIRIETDEKAKTLTISDNGIGMTRDELISDIGTIARSGTKAFIDAMKKNAEANASSPELIGQFGVGFYSSFMVADKVEIITKKAGSEQTFRWVSDGKASYEITEDTRETQGSTVILHLKDDSLAYLDYWKVSSIIKKYSDFIEHPIMMRHTVKKDGKDEGEDSILNSRKAIWLRAESEVSEDEFNSFYTHISGHSVSEPLKRISLSAEGKSEFKALLFLPSRLPFDFQFGERKTNGLHLYVRRVFITDNCPGLIPEYLRFVAGVVDSSDLPLNVSREMLQDNPEILKISKVLTKRIISELGKLFSSEREKYESFYKEFSRLIKEGVHSDYSNREKLQDLLLFETMNSPKGKLVSLKEYSDAMSATQKEIYYITGESREAIENSPHLEILRKQNYDVLFMTDPVDEWVVGEIATYAEKKLKSIAKGDVKFDESVQKELEEKNKKAGEENKGLVEFLKKTLNSRVKDVRFSSRLTESACCLVSDEYDPSNYMQKIMKAMDKNTPNIKRILELNPEHPLIDALRKLQEKSPESARLSEFAEMLYDQALLAEGSPIPDPTLFAKRTAALMTVGVEKEL